LLLLQFNAVSAVHYNAYIETQRTYM